MSDQFAQKLENLLTVTQLVRNVQVANRELRLDCHRQARQISPAGPRRHRLRPKIKQRPVCCSKLIAVRYERRSLAITANQALGDWDGIA